MVNRSIRVSTLDENVTVYDLEGNIIKQIPEPPDAPPKVTYFNIVEYEDRLMGIDSDAKPEFFIDFENDDRFKDLDKDPLFTVSELPDGFSVMVCACTFVIMCFIFTALFVFYDI